LLIQEQLFKPDLSAKGIMHVVEGFYNRLRMLAL